MPMHVLRNLRFDVDADGIGLALIDMPGRPFNVFSEDMIYELAELIEEVDVLAVVGLGFPAWSGGPLAYLDLLRRGEVPGAKVPAELRAAPYYVH